MVMPKLGLFWDFYSWIWGCCVLHQIVSSNLESVGCLQGHMVRPELGMFWNVFELRVEIVIFASKIGYTTGGGVLVLRPLQGPVRSSGGSSFFWCIFHPCGTTTSPLGLWFAWTLNLKLVYKATWSGLTMSFVECFSLEYEDAVSCIRLWAQIFNLRLPCKATWSGLSRACVEIFWVESLWLWFLHQNGYTAGGGGSWHRDPSKGL
jgi:hypothetical protein